MGRHSYAAEHTRNPRTTRVTFGEGWGSGIVLDIGRKGVEVFAYYDSIVGISGGFIPWEEFDRLRRDAQLSLKEATANVAADARKTEILDV